jgi:ribosomal protein S18 acetylase RimI-like enzyme
MYVRPEARRLGVGRLLLAQVLTAADAMPGVRQVTLTVTADNRPARRLYEAHGFVAYGQAPEALFVGGTYHDDLLMVRRVDGITPHSSPG